MLHTVCNTADNLGGAKQDSFLARFLSGNASEKYDESMGDKRGEYVATSDELEKIHMKYAVEGDQSTINSEAKCHYVSYVMGKGGNILELDGRRPLPVVKGKCEDPSMFHL